MTHKRSIGLRNDPGISRVMSPNIVRPYIISSVSGNMQRSSFFEFTHDITYLLEMHADASGTEAYVNGTLLGTYQPLISGMSMMEIGLLYETPGYESEIDSTIKYRIWDLKIGSTRHGTDIFSNPLDSVPPLRSYYYQTGLWKFYSDCDITLVDLNGIDVLAIADNGSYEEGISWFAGQGGPSWTEFWFEFKINFTPGFLNWMLTGEYSHFSELFTNSYASLNPSMQWICGGWDLSWLDDDS